MKEKPNISFDYLYRSTWQSISKMYNEEALKKNSVMTVGFVLISIDYKQGTPSTLLGPKMGIEATSLSRTLKKMEEQGLIYREKNPDDGRSVLIKLTDKGKEQRDISKQIVLKFNDEVAKNLTQKQMDAFLVVTETIQELIQKKLIF
ncbi:MarR family winged helix-turn-helix transcriptional regulator [Wenyingzhuangia sp. 2_MG-2023]|uniref:MarR family winged helix-turn-helix transcriptional regulator n=1 Tax=Wenyingzhuangia sp. 2_MG-2023 TaxID=3062639 RepID=UPI0026E1D75E|nr:MarR family transcriptional regulator [Wenyingzhuangia sp. 2_MG-2023]MDO6737478.1 MarR family transcriptional regulator [Wenyingzhuangia sp. 2_MG-2023]MDO6802781.1 MarR family transcriptional regulator [Wenyingzhuangia sp. 1_MG-2023]